jgi:hypothetical protein
VIEMLDEVLVRATVQCSDSRWRSAWRWLFRSASLPSGHRGSRSRSWSLSVWRSRASSFAVPRRRAGLSSCRCGFRSSERFSVSGCWRSAAEPTPGSDVGGQCCRRYWLAIWPLSLLPTWQEDLIEEVFALASSVGRDRGRIRVEHACGTGKAVNELSELRKTPTPSKICPLRLPKC